MKWTQKGKQFDRLGKIFEKRDKILIYGAHSCSDTLVDYLMQTGLWDRVDGFVDRRFESMSDGYRGCPVYSPEILFEQYDDTHLIIVALGKPHGYRIMDRLVRAGYIENSECFIWTKFMSDFNDIYAPVYAMYTQNRLLLSSICFIPSTACNLKCRDCLNFTTYLPSFEVRGMEELKKDVDLLFKWVDYTQRFQISGGDPLLYPHLNELIVYIGEHYISQIGYFEMVINGTVIPSDETCRLMKKYEMKIFLDNYTEAISEKMNCREGIIKQFESFDIHWVDNTVKEWFDLDIFHTDNRYMGEAGLKEYYDLCNNPWHCFEHGKMYACNFARYAEKTGLHKENNESWLDFRKMTEDRKRELLEFTLNYCDRGYVEMCKRCAGCQFINCKKVPVAVQKEE